MSHNFIDSYQHATLTEWLAQAGTPQAFVVLGPDPAGPAGSRRVLLQAPADSRLATATQALATSTDFGLQWREADSPLVAWSSLNKGLPEAGSWRERWLAHGYRSYVRVEVPLPAMRAFECFLLTHADIRDSGQAARILWDVMALWPGIKLSIRMQHSPLSSAETRCLELAYFGLTAQEAAVEMEIEKRRVEYLYQQAMEKLKAPNKVAALHRASWVCAF